MSMLRVSLFGKFRAVYQSEPVSGFETRKVQELFAYFLLNRDHPHPRETVASALWGEYSTAQSKKHLRQTLWHVNAALEGAANGTGRSFLQVEPEWISLHSTFGLWLDVAVFEAAYERARNVAGDALTPEVVIGLQEAVELYRGDLLEGWYQDWCIYERERLQNLYLTMLDKLMLYCEASGAYELGFTYGSRILKYDRARERTHRRLMRLLYLAGDRTGALRQYDRCVATLAEELNVKPARQTTELYEQIRSDNGPKGLVRVEQGAARSQDLGKDVLGHLKQIQRTLANAEHDVEQDIRAVQEALRAQDS
ncbi:MAG: hypothetical protein IT331_17300 [Anaerolineae bacterium]|nr:hypothetical protein [Anaerolineae bacterium]